MRTMLILSAFPTSDVVVSKAGIFVGAIVDEGMKTRFQAYGIQGLVGEARLQPEARECIPRSLVTAELIILEKGQRMHVHSQRPRIVVGQAVVSGRKTRGKVLGVGCLETEQDEKGDEDFAHGCRGLSDWKCGCLRLFTWADLTIQFAVHDFSCGTGQDFLFDVAKIQHFCDTTKKRALWRVKICKSTIVPSFTPPMSVRETL